MNVRRAADRERVLGEIERMKTIPYIEYKEGIDAVIDTDTCPVHMRVDFLSRNENVVAGNKLCERCDGTGNELMSMYRACQKCGGNGRA